MMRRSKIEKIWSAKLGRWGEGVPKEKVLRHGRELEKQALGSIKEWVCRNFKTEQSAPLMKRCGEAMKEIDRQVEIETRRAA